MASINSKNIFDVVKKKYAPNQPEKNHKIDPVYSLFDRDDPLPKCQELAFFTDTSICTGCKACEVACKQWNQLESDPYHWSGDSYDNTGDLSANNWRHVKFMNVSRKITPWIVRLHKPLMRCSKNRKPVNGCS